MPSLEEQLRTIKDVLHDFDVSETLYVLKRNTFCSHVSDFNPTGNLFDLLPLTLI